MTTLADFKRQLNVGQKFHCENFVRPEATGDREVAKVQTNCMAYWFTTAAGERKMGWVDYPTAKDCRIEGNSITFLDGAQGPLWTYTFSEP